MYPTKPKSRDLVFSGEVTQRSIAKLTEDVLGVINYDAQMKIGDQAYKPDPIRIYIDSYGGDAYSVLGLISIIEASSTPIHTVATGAAMSAGFLLLVSGHTRFCYRHTTMMVHQLAYDFSGDLKSSTQELRESTRLQKNLSSVVKRHTNITKERLDEIDNKKEDWYMSSAEAKRNGVVDVILTKHDDLFMYE